MSNLPDHSAQRASDADREAVLEVLQAAVADGRLDLTEFDERMAHTYEAKTFGELAPLTADLQGVGSHSPAGTPSLSRQADQDLVITSMGSTMVRRGRWVVPRRVVVDSKMGSVSLDLTEAQILSKVVELNLNTSMGSVVIIVPDNTHIDADSLQVNFGTAKVRVPPSGTPELSLRLTGKVNMGSVVVRRMGFFKRWKLARATRRKALGR